MLSKGVLRQERPAVAHVNLPMVCQATLCFQLRKSTVAVEGVVR
jgi:hypothetical protein